MNGRAPAAFGVTVDATNGSSGTLVRGFYQAFDVINIVNTEGIQEVSTNKSIAPASVAGSVSGYINIITKNGSNDFHGSLRHKRDTRPGDDPLDATHVPTRMRDVRPI